MHKSRIYMQIMNFKKLFMKLFIRKNDSKMINSRINGYLPKTY